MTTPIDFDFRPHSYFGPQTLDAYLLANVKGAMVRDTLQTLSNEGRRDEVRSLLGADGISSDITKALEKRHPMFMGGNYLPNMKDGEIEIARIRIDSTTCDITSVYARHDQGEIRYRIVDEYDGDTMEEATEMTSTHPLTLGELTDFFLTAWPLADCVISNFDNDLDGGLGFFTAESNFYPEFDRLCRQRVEQAYAEISEDHEEAEVDAEQEDEFGDTCPVCGYFNATPAADTCRHFRAWDWDGHLDCSGVVDVFQRAWREVCELLATNDDNPDFQSKLAKALDETPALRLLVLVANDSHSCLDVLTKIAGAEVGDGWSTNGMFGGTGFNIYLASDDKLIAATTHYRALTDLLESRTP